MKKIFFITAMTLFIGLVFTACSGNDSKAKTEQLAKDEMYTCTMHNEVMSDHPGSCPKCGMKLVKQKMTADQQKMMENGTYTKPKE
jgi:Cu(I)/Ag(I) efflux system membrane fusion protein